MKLFYFALLIVCSALMGCGGGGTDSEGRPEDEVTAAAEAASAPQVQALQVQGPNMTTMPVNCAVVSCR